MKLIKTILYFLFPLCSFSQVQDYSKKEKWINFHRKRGIGETSIGNWDDKKYISSNGDTLTRSLAKSMGTGEILYESSYLHNQKNGLEIAYYSNGIVKEINYYLDGRLWETIFRADSTGKLLNSGTLHDGNGTKLFYDHLWLEPNCYETYRNGLPEGPYYIQTGTSTAARGQLTYKKSAVNYLPAKKVTYIGSAGEKSTGIFETDSFESVFHNSRNSPDLKLISVSDDSVAQSQRDFTDLSISFPDPAIIPWGRLETY